MANKQFRFLAVLSALNLLFLFAASPADAADGPNRVTSSDVAAGRWMDSLLDPNQPVSSLTKVNRPRPQRRVAQGRPSLRGKLVRNSRNSDGSPAFALLDRDGGILRYVEPVDSVDLRKHLGRVISVRHDTGDTLLATQLALPRASRTRAKAGLQLAQHLEPIPAGVPIGQGSATRGPAPHVHHHAGPPVEEIIESPIEIDGPDNGPIYLDGGYEEGHDGGGFDNGGYETCYDGSCDTGSGYGGYDDYGDSGLNFGGCTNCGSQVCRQFGGCGPGSRGKAYIRGEYLLWWFDGMDTPALVTQSNATDGGVLPNPSIPGDNPSTRILFGGEDILSEDPRSGGRVIFGVWLDDAGRQGIEFDFFGFGTESLTFSVFGADGNPTISRPYFDLFPDANGDGVIDFFPREAAEQVSSDILDGRVTVNIQSDFESYGLRFRHNLCCCGSCSTDCGDGVGCGNGIGCGSGVGVGGLGCGGGTRRIDLLTGVRFTRLEESLGIREDLTVDAGDSGSSNNAGLPPDGTQFIVNDLFETKNEFIGGELGFLWEVEYRRVSLELLSKLAIGNTRQRARISGTTEVITDPPTVPTPAVSQGGLLAQRSNIGTYERDEFSVMPEVGFTLGYRMTPRLKLTAGYTLLYWTNVLRPGDQIDREINGTQIPDFDSDGTPIPPGTLTGPLRPEFEFHNTNLWAHGINLGGEYRW